MAKREYLDRSGLVQVLVKVGDRLEELDGLPHFVWASSIDERDVAERTVVVPEKVVWDEVGERFLAFNSGVYYQNWPGVEKWMNVDDGEPRKGSRIYIGEDEDGNYGVYVFLSYMQPQRLATMGDLPKQGLDGKDGVAYWLCPSIGAVKRAGDKSPEFSTKALSATAYISEGGVVREYSEAMVNIAPIVYNSGEYKALTGETARCGEPVEIDGLYTMSNDVVRNLNKLATNRFRFTLYGESGEAVATAEVPIYTDGATGAKGDKGDKGEDAAAAAPLRSFMFELGAGFALRPKAYDQYTHDGCIALEDHETAEFMQWLTQAGSEQGYWGFPPSILVPGLVRSTGLAFTLPFRCVGLVPNSFNDDQDRGGMIYALPDMASLFGGDGQWMFELWIGPGYERPEIRNFSEEPGIL
ncbi:MAG: hypothetical protein NC102_00280 [Clostridium sp.]|nr:hypothetical protein [Clostridium sp.]